MGDDDQDQARRWVGDALLLAVSLGVLVTIVLVAFAPLLVDLMGATPEVAEPAVSYLRIRAFSTTAVLIVMVGHGAFRGHKDTVTPLKVVVVINALNLILDPLLIFGLGLGLEGAAIATVIAQVFGAIWFLRLLIRQRMASRPVDFADSLPTLFTLGKNGVLLTARTGFLLMPAGRSGPAYIATENVYVLKKYNESDLYALFIGHLADRLSAN